MSAIVDTKAPTVEFKSHANGNIVTTVPFEIEGTADNQISFDDLEFEGEVLTEEELEEAISLASFKQDIEMLPEGLETLVGEKGVALSGGQKQRISIARALIRKPEILILDDSLSAVDAKTEQKIITNIKKERQAKTTIITTHRMTAVQHADHIIVMEDGHITEHGTHDELMKLNGWYKEQYITQQTKVDAEEVEVKA